MDEGTSSTRPDARSCLLCARAFVPKSSKRPGRFCSNYCSTTYAKGKLPHWWPQTCLACGELFVGNGSCCSRKCNTRIVTVRRKQRKAVDETYRLALVKQKREHARRNPDLVAKYKRRHLDNLPEISCKNCGVRFKRSAHVDQRLCRPECPRRHLPVLHPSPLHPADLRTLMASISDNKNGWVSGPCVTCGQSFTTVYSGGPTVAKYCSNTCNPKRSSGLGFVFVAGCCHSCGDSFTQRVGVGSTLPKYCSTACAKWLGRTRFRIPSHVRLAIYERDGWVCQICLEPVPKDLNPLDDWAPSLDHIRCQSWDEQPDHSPENLRLAHRWCNSVRGDETYYSDADLQLT